MVRTLVASIASALVLCGCDMASSIKEGMAQSEQAAAAIEKQLGNKPEVGFNYHNGSFTAATVQFHAVPSVSLAEVEKISRAAVVAAFKKEPDNLVVSFVFQRVVPGRPGP
jgi:hypothetical protein